MEKAKSTTPETNANSTWERLERFSIKRRRKPKQVSSKPSRLPVNDKPSPGNRRP